MSVPLRAGVLTVLLSGGVASACDRVPLGLAQQTVLAAQRSSLPPAVLLALVCAESSFRIDAVSEAGAIGLGQLMPGTARELGVNPWDPVQNLSGAARYLAQQLRTFGGQLPLALAAYHAGAGNVQAYGGVPPLPKTQAYVAKVLLLTPRFDASWRAWVAPLAIPAARPLPVAGAAAKAPAAPPASVVAGRGPAPVTSPAVSVSATTRGADTRTSAPDGSTSALASAAGAPTATAAAVPPAPAVLPTGMALTRAAPAPTTGSGSRLAVAETPPPAEATP
ncbi:lytic transglycosylase domain-containing protein [Deinococcus sonorensis]|uniref:Lytic transglycosylase domain-containing protein n=1 Tax=Deinococcus sonorensis TaxID=309891 RepID=A0ABV8YBQ0_9DEIO